MPRIHLLPDLLIAQIAAGEVVERPSSALKELIENSLDAGAGQIDIRLESGGMKLMSVQDDGSGMGPDDLPLALARHATSKIVSLDDLERVSSLGFRGEALASMASVARLSITSRRADLAHAYQVEAAGATAGSAVPAALSRGTVVSAADLFFNTPARRKFLRSEATEYAHCAEVVRRMALARPDVAFTLTHNGRVQARYPTHSLHERIAAVLGEDFVAASVAVHAEAGPLSLTGLAALPAYSKSGREAQFIFVSGRYVRDKVLSHARARSLSGCPAPRPPSGLCPVSPAAAGRGGRQRPSGQDRSALSRQPGSAPVPVPCRGADLVWRCSQGDGNDGASGATRYSASCLQPLFASERGPG